MGEWQTRVAMDIMKMIAELRAEHENLGEAAGPSTCLDVTVKRCGRPPRCKNKPKLPSNNCCLRFSLIVLVCFRPSTWK